MSRSEIRPETPDVAAMIEQYVEKALSDAAKYDNSEPLDSSGVYSLHRLASEIYAIGWSDGHILGYDQGYRAARRDTESRPKPATTDTPA